MAAQSQKTLMRPLALMLARLLLTSYFIAMSVDLIAFTPGKALMARLLPVELADPAFTVFLFVAAVLIVLNQHLRAATLLLSVFVFWASFLAHVHQPATQDFAAFWQSLTLIAALVLCYAESDPAFSQKSWLRMRAKVAPRRVRPKRRRIGRPRPASTRRASASAFGEDTYAEEFEAQNIFAAAFD